MTSRSGIIRAFYVRLALVAILQPAASHRHQGTKTLFSLGPLVSVVSFVSVVLTRRCHEDPKVALARSLERLAGPQDQRGFIKYSELARGGMIAAGHTVQRIYVDDSGSVNPTTYYDGTAMPAKRAASASPRKPLSGEAPRENLSISATRSPMRGGRRSRHNAQNPFGFIPCAA